MEGSQTLANLITSFIQTYGARNIVIGRAGGGTELTGTQIVLDPDMLSGISASNPAYTATVVTELAHELGHATQPDGDTNSNFAASPAQAATIGDNSEGVATYQEWLVARDLGATMWDGSSNNYTSNPLQQQLNTIATQDGGINSQTQADATSYAANYFATYLSPSNAPNFSYSQYYSDNWIAYQCGLGVANVNWGTATPSEFQTVYNSNGSCTVASSTVPLLTGGSVNVNGTFSPGSAPNSVSVDFQNSNGSTIGTDTLSTSTSGQVDADVTGQATADLSDAAISLAANAAATVAGDANAIAAAAGASVTIGAGSASNTVNATGIDVSVNTSANGESVASGPIAVVSNIETVSYNYTQVEVSQGAFATVTGTDGTATLSNDVGGSGNITANINWNAGGSEEQSITQSGDTTTELSNGYSGSNGGGTQLYQQTTTTNSAGAVSATISGSGDTTYLSNASITLASGTQAGIDGIDDAIIAAANDTLTLGGTQNTVTAGTGATVNVTAGGDVITGTEITLSLSANATANLTGNGNTVVANGSGDDVDMTGTGNYYYGGTGDTANVIGNGANGQNGADQIIGWGITVNLAQDAGAGVYGNNNTVSANGSGDAVGLSGDGNTFDGTPGATVTVSNNGANGQHGGDIISGSQMTVELSTDAGANITGNGDTVVGNGSDDAADMTGAGNYFYGSAGDTANVIGNGTNGEAGLDYVLGPQVTINLAQNAGAVVDGNSNTVAASNGGDYAVLDGDSNTYYGVAGESVAVSGNGVDGENGGDQINGSGMTVGIATDAGAAITGSQDTINGNAGDAVHLGATGTGTDTVDMSNGQVDADAGNVNINGSTDTIYASGVVFTFGANETHLTIIGDDNIVDASDDEITFDGDGNDTYGNSDLVLADGSSDETFGDSDIDEWDETDGGDDGDGGGDGDALRGDGFGLGGGTTNNSSDTNVTLSDNQKVTFTGAGNTITVASGDTVATNDSGPNSVLISGDNSAVSDSGTGDSYTVSGQNDTLSVSNATITLQDNISAAFAGTTISSIAIGSNDWVTLDGGSAGNQISMNGSGSTLSDNGFAETIVVGGQGNAIDISGAAQSSLKGLAVTFGSAGEEITLGGLQSVTIASGVEASIIGSDGTLTVNDNAEGGLVQNVIDWNVGGSDVQNFSTLANGSIEEDDIGYSGSDGSGTQLYEQTITTATDGTVSSTISGSGAVSALSVAATTLSDSASAAFTGDGNSITAGANDTIAIQGGQGNTITVSGNNTAANDDLASSDNSFLLNGTGGSAVLNGANDTVTLGGDSNTATITTNAGSGTVIFSGTNDTATVAGASSGSIVFDSDTIGTLLLQSAQDFTGTVAGLGDTDSIDLANLSFANGAAISSATGTGAAGTDTVLTITDDGVNAQILLLNQFASQYASNASAYTLTADSTQPNAGTLLQLAAAH